MKFLFDRWFDLNRDNKISIMERTLKFASISDLLKQEKDSTADTEEFRKIVPENMESEEE